MSSNTSDPIYIGYWRETQQKTQNTTDNLLSYPECNHPSYSHTFPYPRPNHFDNFWKKVENTDFIAKLTKNVLLPSKKWKAIHDTTSLCRLCGKHFYDTFEYIYHHKNENRIYYISSTLTHYLIDHKIIPCKKLQNLVISTKQNSSNKICDDWIDISTTHNST